MAMEIITRDKKEIQWKGLPSTNIKEIEELKVFAIITLRHCRFLGTNIEIDKSNQSDYYFFCPTGTSNETEEQDWEKGSLLKGLRRTSTISHLPLHQ